jgi:cytochrome P450
VVSVLSSRTHGTAQLDRMGPVATIQAFRRDPLGLFADVAGRPDGMARATLLGKDLVFITHPDHVHHVLQENHQNYDKNALIYNNARPFLGNGLPVTHGGEDWIRRRRLMQPAFHRRHVQIVTDATERYLADTTAGLNRIAASGEPLDISLELTRLTMRIICRVLFDVDVAVGSTEIARRFERVSMFAVDFLTRPFPPLFVPTRRNRAFHADMRYINEFVTGIVRERQAGPQRHEDLLDLLVHAGEGAEGLSRQQVQDELISMFYAGHDTTAHTLAWSWYLLALHREADLRLSEELDTVLAGRPATAADLPNLPYTRMVIQEAMRLYPVVWAMMRRAIGEDVIAGHRIPAGALVTWSPYAGNRHPDIWDDPESFRPQRFDPGHSVGRRRHAALPFGEGPRVCIGSDFAMAEAVLILATLAQHHRLVLLPDRPVRPGGGITLHPAGGIWAVLEPRSQ